MLFCPARSSYVVIIDMEHNYNGTFPMGKAPPYLCIGAKPRSQRRKLLALNYANCNYGLPLKVHSQHVAHKHRQRLLSSSRE